MFLSVENCWIISQNVQATSRPAVAKLTAVILCWTGAYLDQCLWFRCVAHNKPLYPCCVTLWTVSLVAHFPSRCCAQISGQRQLPRWLCNKNGGALCEQLCQNNKHCSHGGWCRVMPDRACGVLFGCLKIQLHCCGAWVNINNTEIYDIALIALIKPSITIT